MDQFKENIISAVVSRDLSEVKRLLGPVDIHSTSLQPVLAKAFVESAGRDASILRWFLELGFDINAADEEGDTALMVAARGEDVVGSIDEEKSFRGNNIIQAAFQSVECLKNVQELLSRRANVDLANKEGRTALIQATQIGGNSEIVALLVAAKCNVLAVDDKKYSALHYAAAGAQTDNVRLLLKSNADVDGKTLDGDSALHKACEAGSFEVAQELLQCNIDIDGENSEKRSPLMLASQFGSLAIVQELIRRGADVNKRDHIGMTALQLAVQGSADVDVVKCLVEAKSDIENTCIEEYSAETVLIRAIKSSSEDVVKYLLSKGANIETADKDGQTPLIVASSHKLHNMIEILLDSGASIEASDKVGCTALMRAVINLDKHGAEVLVQRGANVHSQNKLGFSALSLAMYKDIEFGKSLYTTYRKSFPTQTPTNPLEIQRTSSSMESLHIGDMIFLSIDGGTVMGCDGFVQKTLQSTTVDEEWEDHVFCIHPKLSYDHVNMSPVDHPYFQISDPYSEDEREKKRNSLKLSQILNSKELVTSDTVIQLYHVKSQQYLRLNPMAAENESNVCLDHLASFYSWFQFRSDYGNDIYTWSPVSLVSACVPATSIGATKTKPVYLVASRVKKTVEIGLHTTYDPLLHAPFKLAHNSNSICGDSSRQVPLPHSLGLKVKPAKGEILSAFELERSSDGKSYEIRHVVSRFFLGIECPCSGKEQVVASLVNATLGASVATVSFEIKSSTQAKDHSVEGNESASSMLYRFSHTCTKCERNWMLSTQQEKVVWNHHGAWFSCSPIEPENVQKMYHVCSWRERYLNLVHDAILFLGKDVNETALRQSIHNVHVVSKQICDLLEARTVDGVGDSLLHICSDIIILEAMFLATSVFRAITSFDEAKEMMVQFFRAMRVLVVGNTSFESYLQDQFEHPIGKIKILSGLDMEFASNYVDARTIMTSMISKNSSSVAYLLEALDTSDNVDSLSWTNKAQFLIALSLTERAHSVTAYKLYDHEIKMTDIWLKNWDTMAVETTLKGDIIWVRWNDCCRGRLLSSTALNRNYIKDIGLTNAEVDDSHIALPLQDIVNALQKKDNTTEAQSFALENWIIIYLHHLKLVSALSLKNTDVRPRFFTLFPPELLVEGACNTFLSFPLRSQYLELFCSLYIPRVSTPESVQYTSLFLGINEALSINIAILKRLEKLIESSLIDSVNDDPAYFGFIERLLIVMNGLIDIGWYAYEKGKCVQSVTWLYSVGMKWDYITSFEVQRLLDNDPFNLLSRSISGSNIIVTCQRLILPIARKLTRYSIVAKSDDFFFFKAQSGLENKVKQPIVHYLSSLLTHSDTLVAQEAFLNLFELLPEHSFDWLRVDKPLCAHLKKSDNVLLRQLFAEANSIFGSGVHVIRGSIEIKHKADGKKKKVIKPPTQQLQDAALIVKKWRMDAPTNFLLLRLAHIPERIIGYIQDCLAQNVFVVPPNDVLAAECRYYLTTVPPFDLGDNELLYLYRQSKEKIVEDRIHLVKLFFDMMKLLAPFLSEDLSLSLLKLMVPLLKSRPSLVDDVASLVLLLLRQPYTVIDSRFTDVFMALLKHVHHNEAAGRCVIDLLRQSKSDEWKNEAMFFLFHSTAIDLKKIALALPKQIHIFDMVCIVADGSSNKSIYGHLESKSVLSLKWIVGLLNHPNTTQDHQRVSLMLIKTLYLDSELEKSWLLNELSLLTPAFQFCLNHLETGIEESVLILGIVPFLRSWTALAVKKDNYSKSVREYHWHLHGTMKRIASVLENVAAAHSFSCANAHQRLEKIIETLKVPSMCANMGQLTMLKREIHSSFQSEPSLFPPKKALDPRACLSRFYKETKDFLSDKLAPFIAVSQLRKYVTPAVLKAHERLQQWLREDEEVGHLLTVAQYLADMQRQEAPSTPDLISLIITEQENYNRGRVAQRSKGSRIPQLNQMKSFPALRSAKLKGRTFRGKKYQSIDTPKDRSIEKVEPLQENESILTNVYNSWKLTVEPIDTHIVMESLVRLITYSSSASMLGLRVFIESLATKRKIAEDRKVVDEKYLLHVRLEWKKLLSTAVKANVSSLVFWCVRDSSKDLSNPIKSQLAMNLLAELLADGFQEAQDALFDAYDSLDDDFKVDLFKFLMSHLFGLSHEMKLSTLNVFQLLCEGHHTNWQGMMRSIRFNRCILDAVINLMSAVCKQAGGVFSLSELEILSNSLEFLSEACQGPCLENQQYLVESVVPRLCADLSLGSIQCESGQYPLLLTKLKYSANESLLSLVEGRGDQLVHLHLAELLEPHVIANVLVTNRLKIKEIQKSKRNYELSDVIFVESMELLRIVYSLLSKVSSGTENELYDFAKKWREAEADNDDLQFFVKKIISVEVVRSDSTIKVYFPRPKEAKYLKQPEKRRLLNIMNLGEENALAVFTSAESRNIAEELRTRHVLATNGEYEWMNEWQTSIRWWMFIVCLYINFVMVIGLSINPDDGDPVVHIWIEWLLSVFGGVFCIMCSSLWLYNLITEATFAYARQLLRPNKLRRMSRKEISKELWDAIGSVAFTIVGWLAIFAAINMEYGFDDDVTFAIMKVSGAYIIVLIILALHKIGSIYHFSYIEGKHTYNDEGLGSSLLFWFNAFIDTITRGKVYVFTTYTFCAFMGLSHSSPLCYLYYGLPLLDILAINPRLSNILKAITSNLAPLGVTMAFGAIVIYLFSLIGFFRYQDLMKDNASNMECSSMMQCFFTYMHYGLLSGGGIGDYISNTMSHPLDYSQPDQFYERLVFDLAFYIFILVLLVNLIMGIIIDSFTSLRESSEKKVEIEMNTCLVCNETKDDIEYRGILLGLSNNFKRHTEEDHNLWHYLFFIMYLDAKPSNHMNGTESFVYGKLLAKEMSWIPKRMNDPALRGDYLGQEN